MVSEGHRLVPANIICDEEYWHLCAATLAISAAASSKVGIVDINVDKDASSSPAAIKFLPKPDNGCRCSNVAPPLSNAVLHPVMCGNIGSVIETGY
jgi:hypothetical protein